MFELLDAGGGEFEIAYGNQRIPIKYGEYALAIANIDYDKLQAFIEEYLKTIIETTRAKIHKTGVHVVPFSGGK